MKTLPEETIKAIATEHAHHVAPTGSPGADLHNTNTIAWAIRAALEKLNEEHLPQESPDGRPT